LNAAAMKAAVKTATAIPTPIVFKNSFGVKVSQSHGHRFARATTPAGSSRLVQTGVADQLQIGGRA
jgi:hypothetical protein